MPSLRRTDWFFLPPPDEQVVPLANLAVIRRVLCWGLAMMLSSSVLWLLYGCLWYTVFVDYNHAILRYYLDIPMHIHSSLYSLIFSYIIALFTIPEQSKCFIAMRMGIAYGFLMFLELLIVIYNYRSSRVKGDPTTSCCGIYYIHITVEYAVFQSALLLITYSLVWCERYRTRSSIDTSADHSSDFIEMVKPRNSGRRNTYLTSPIFTSVKPMCSPKSEISSLPPPMNEQQSDSAMSNSEHIGPDLLQREQLAFNLEIISDEQRIQSEQYYRLCTLGYWCTLTVATSVWIQFARISASFANTHYKSVMLAFYLSCFLFKRPLRWLSSRIDYYRIRMRPMSMSVATLNDVSIEIVNEWMLGVFYYTYVNVRAIASGVTVNGGESDETMRFFNQFLFAKAVHIVSELWVSGIIVLPLVFSSMKRVRKYLRAWILGDDDLNPGSLSGIFGYFRSSLFWLLERGLQNFRPHSSYESFRDRCFVDSNLRLLCAVITGIVAWTRAWIVFSLDYNLGNHVASFRMSNLVSALKYLFFGILCDLLIFGVIHVWFEWRYEYASYYPIYRLIQKTKNPSYLFCALCTASVWIQISMFQ